MDSKRPSVQMQYRSEKPPEKPFPPGFWNPTLNIEFKAGHCMAFLYGHLVWMNFEPELGIMMHFSSHTVRLEGRNLGTLYDELLELRLRYVKVVEKDRDAGAADDVVVHRATVEQLSSESTKPKKRSGRVSPAGDGGEAA